MKLFVRDNRAICTCCSGLVTAKKNYYFCTDCGAVFIGVEDGDIEGEVIVAPARMTKRQMLN